MITLDVTMWPQLLQIPASHYPHDVPGCFGASGSGICSTKSVMTATSHRFVDLAVDSTDSSTKIKSPSSADDTWACGESRGKAVALLASDKMARVQADCYLHSR
jgi:hypothetical protein